MKKILCAVLAVCAVMAGSVCAWGDTVIIPGHFASAWTAYSESETQYTWSAADDTVGHGDPEVPSEPSSPSAPDPDPESSDIPGTTEDPETPSSSPEPPANPSSEPSTPAITPSPGGTDTLPTSEPVTDTRSYTNAYTFTMSAPLQSGILSAFPGLTEGEVYQLSDSEILSGTWSVGDDDMQELSGRNERAVLNIPAIMPQNSGVYIMRLTLSDATAGTKIALHGISGGASISVSALQDMQYVFLDENGSTIDTVPDSKTVYAAMRLTAGTETRGIVTVPSEVSAPVRLAKGTVVPLEESEELKTIIADELSLDLGQIKFIKEENILQAQEPTQEMMQEMIETAKDDNYDLIGQLSTIHVEDPGYYVLKIALSDDLFSQIESADINTVAMYAFAAVMGDANVNASFMVNGLVGTWELLTVSGRKFDKFTMKEFLMVGFLDAGEPFTLFLAKAILSVLTGGLGAGCNTGLGLAGMSAVMFILLLKKRR